MFGGGEVWMLRTMRALRKRGHRIALCCRPGTKLAFDAFHENFPVYEIEFRGDFDPLSIGRIAWLFAREKIDAVLTNMDKELRLCGLAAKCIPRGPVVIPRRGIDYPLKDQFQYRFSYNVLAVKIIANSEATKKALLRNAPWLEPGKIEVIYNGIDAAPFEKADGRAFREQWGIAADVPVLGFVGQLDERKGIGVLLTAYSAIVAKLPEVRLVFAGDGPLREMIESEARSNGWGERVKVLGFQENIAEVMSAIDILLLPSFWEGFGIVIIEAMAAGKPVISTNISSMPEIIVVGETGYLIEPGDSDALAEKSCRLLQDPTLRKSMGEKGHERVVTVFNHITMINHLESLLKSEIAKKRRGKPRMNSTSEQVS